MKQISNETLFEAMEGIGDDLLMRSETVVAKKTQKPSGPVRKNFFFHISAVAAIAMMALLAGNTLRFGKSGSADVEYAAVQEQPEKKAASERMESVNTGTATEAEPDPGAETEPAAEESAPDFGAETEPAAEEAAPDGKTEACFVYRGVFYREQADGEISAEEITIGDYVTTVTLDADETGDASIPYSEGTGNIAGDVYTVRGEDPREVLCIPEEDGTVRLLYAQE